jgi:hypothetical protein
VISEIENCESLNGISFPLSVFFAARGKKYRQKKRSTVLPQANRHLRSQTHR